MALVPHGQVGVVRDDPTVVQDKSRAIRGKGQQQEVANHLGVQRTSHDDDVKHLVLSYFDPFIAGRIRHKYLWLSAQDSNSLAKFPTVALTWGG